MSSDYYGHIAGEIADEGYVPEPIGEYWVDDEGECSICLETLTDCTCLDNLRPAAALEDDSRDTPSRTPLGEQSW